jgi:hypothetical protein
MLPTNQRNSCHQKLVGLLGSGGQSGAPALAHRTEESEKAPQRRHSRESPVDPGKGKPGAGTDGYARGLSGLYLGVRAGPGLSDRRLPQRRGQGPTRKRVPTSGGGPLWVCLLCLRLAGSVVQSGFRGTRRAAAQRYLAGSRVNPLGLTRAPTGSPLAPPEQADACV